MAKLAFLGLGVMGYPMAGWLAKAGHEAVVFNRTFSKAQKWQTEFRGKALKTAAEAADDADFVLSCVGNDDDLREIYLGGSGALAAMKPGAILIDHTTASASVARELADAARRAGIGFVDAPVSGGQAGAENGALTIMSGGSEADYQRAEPVMQAYARACRRMGEAGAGQLTKMVNQICIGGLIQALAEGLNFAGKAGLDGEEVIAAISQGAAGSWQISNRSETMLAGEYDHGFAVEWMRKDLRICLEEARNNGARLPVTALIDQFYGDVEDMGGARWGTSSLLARLKALSGGA